MSNDAEITSTSTSYVVIRETMILVGGTYRVYFDIKTANSGYAAYGKVYVNGVAVGTERMTTGDTNYHTVATQDFIVKPGDLLQIYIHTNSVSYAAYLRNVKLCGTLSTGVGVNTK
jgi:hypothetical protein